MKVTQNTLDPSMNKAEWFEQVVKTQQAGLLRYSFSLLKQHDRAQDVVQEAFLKLWQAPMQKVADHVRPWLFMVCRHLIIDMKRKEKQVIYSNHEQYDKESEQKMPQPTQQLEEQETQQAMLKIIAELPENQQEVLRLRIQQELSYKEISQITGHSVTYVGVLLHQSIQAIRKGFDQSLQAIPGGIL